MPFIRDNINALKQKIQSLGSFFIDFLKQAAFWKNANGQTWPNVCQWKNLFKILSKPEKYLVWVFIILIVTSSGYLLRVWYLNNTELSPKAGGSYTEAAIGVPRYINPVLSSTNDIDRDLVTIIYSGLLKYDYNGQLIPDLSESYKISDDKKTYDFTLRQNAKWHDGKSVTADDVIFTIQTIQNVEYRSPLRASLQGVEAEKIDEFNIRFRLKNPYSPFLDNLTFGILPAHIWENIPAVSFSLSDYNLNPIGSGPYKIQKTQKGGDGSVQQIELSAFSEYHLNPPYLESIIFKFFKDEASALAVFNNNNADGVSYISANKIAKLRPNVNVNEIILPRYFAVFFNQSENKALTDKNVRQALLSAINQQEIINKTVAGQAVAIDSPIPYFILDKPSSNAGQSFNPEKAKDILDSSGWQVNATTTLREKIIDKAPVSLEINLLTVNWPELVDVDNMIKTSWENIGVKVNLEVKSVAEIQERIKARQYQALLFGQILGANPDPFAFWHSSQKKDPGLNLSLLENKEVDKVLEEIRQETNPEIKKQKYEKLNQIISQEIPAIFLYSPIYFFPTDKAIKGINIEKIHLPSERFSLIETWYIKTKRVWKQD